MPKNASNVLPAGLAMTPAAISGSGSGSGFGAAQPRDFLLSIYLYPTDEIRLIEPAVLRNNENTRGLPPQ
jgi:hypothetical protein